MYEANRLTMYEMSGCVVIAMYCNSPSRLANTLLQSPAFPSGFSTRATFGSSGVLTEFDCPRPSLSKINLIYLLEEIKILSGDIVSSILTIFIRTLRSVISHLLSILAFILSLSAIVVANVSMSSTHTAIIAKSSPARQM